MTFPLNLWVNALIVVPTFSLSFRWSQGLNTVFPEPSWASLRHCKRSVSILRYRLYIFPSSSSGWSWLWSESPPHAPWLWPCDMMIHRLQAGCPERGNLASPWWYVWQMYDGLYHVLVNISLYSPPVFHNALKCVNVCASMCVYVCSCMHMCVHVCACAHPSTHPPVIYVYFIKWPTTLSYVGISLSNCCLTWNF